MNYRIMERPDISKVVPLYMNYYNTQENGQWTEQTTFKRIHQVFSREDSYCLVLEENGEIIAFAMGYFEQFDDCVTYDLVEIVVASHRQHQGIGTKFMAELEQRVKEKGALLIQLLAVNDEFHQHFYGKLGYHDAGNLSLKGKLLS